MKTYLILAGVSLAIGLTVGAGFGYDQADSKRKAEVAELEAKHIKEKESALEKSRKWYRDAMAEQQEKLEDLKDALDKIADDKRAVDKSYDGLLKDQRKLYTQLAARRCDTSNVADDGASSATARVLAELSEVPGKLAGIYAHEADTVRDYGVACTKERKSLDKNR